MKSTITATSNDDTTVAAAATPLRQPREDLANLTNPTSNPTDGTTNNETRRNFPESPGRMCNSEAIFPTTNIPTARVTETPTNPRPVAKPVFEYRYLTLNMISQDPATEKLAASHPPNAPIFAALIGNEQRILPAHNRQYMRPYVPL
jgi:hypothetical protein